VTIPLAVREALGIEAGTEVDFELDDQIMALTRG
jgi:AbrB family looped-hinge helix DNA binding protein